MLTHNAVDPLEGLTALYFNAQPIWLAQSLRRSSRRFDTIFDGGNPPVIDELFATSDLNGRNEVLIGHVNALPDGN